MHSFVEDPTFAAHSTKSRKQLGNETLGNEKFDVFSSSAHLFI